ncbi:unnamed protein product [Closterium sp. Naga37s-1]|nr:unnamed protein product [Closterium sp. Naga37s-1]
MRARCSCLVAHDEPYGADATCCMRARCSCLVAHVEPYGADATSCMRARCSCLVAPDEPYGFRRPRIKLAWNESRQISAALPPSS